ncbi:MAG: DUF3301 domain-containing protein [Gammaproteobacteria bacterium]|nr:DUF3301 domain-containing protein [Gammaproteobacteria bacterium]
MLNLSVLFWLCCIAALAAFWWHSDGVKSLALKQVDTHCQKLGLQLLDQTMVIKGLSPVRGESGSLCLRRRYRFEFTSTGEQRYRGLIVMVGRKQQAIELEPHILPEDQVDTLR